MGEFSRSGAQMPTEQRRMVQEEHEKELRDSAELKHHHEDESKKRPWWKFWERGS